MIAANNYCILTSKLEASSSPRLGAEEESEDSHFNDRITNSMIWPIWGTHIVLPAIFLSWHSVIMSKLRVLGKPSLNINSAAVMTRFCWPAKFNCKMLPHKNLHDWFLKQMLQKNIWCELVCFENQANQTSTQIDAMGRERAWDQICACTSQCKSVVGGFRRIPSKCRLWLYSLFRSHCL